MADNTTPRGFLSYPNQGDESWYAEDSSGQGLEDWLAAIELFGIPTYATFGDLPAAGTPETNGEQRQFAAVVGDRTVYRTDGSSWTPWFGGGTPARPLPGTTHMEAVSAGEVNITDGGTTESALIAVAATGQTTLSSGAATVDTGLSSTDATFYLALGIDDPDADAKVAGRLFWDDSAGTYNVEIVEDGTSVGNPTVNYDVLRVR